MREISPASHEVVQQRALVSTFRLRARRGNDRWASSARLDLGLEFRPLIPIQGVRVTFALKRGGIVPPNLRRVLTLEQPFLPGLFPKLVWLSDAGGFFSINGLEPITDYTAIVEKVEYKIGGTWVLIPASVTPITDLTPNALNEEIIIPIPSPAPGSKTIPFPVLPGTLRVGRARFRIERVASAAGQEQVEFHVSGSATDQEAIQLLEVGTPLGVAARPAAVGNWRDYDVFVPVLPGGGLFQFKAQLGTNFKLTQLGLASTEATDISWMHTMQYNYSTPVIPGGWIRQSSLAGRVEDHAWWETNWTKISDPANQTHVHGLVVATPGAAGFNSWKLENFFVRPFANPDGSINKNGCYSYRNRLIRSAARLRVPAGAAVNKLSFTYTTAGFVNTFIRVTAPPPGEDFIFNFYWAPQHNLSASTENDRKTVFTFTRANDTTAPAVMLEELRGDEVLIGDLPEGQGYATYTDDWPQISIPTLEGESKLVNPTPSACPVTGPPAPAPFMVNDHGWALADGKWHVYGIYESGVAIKPMPPPPPVRIDVSPLNTIGTTSYFVSGLAHVQACDAGALFHGEPGTDYLDYFRSQPPGNTSEQLMVPVGPGECFNLWAPTIIEWNGAFWMFYSSFYGNDIWLAKSTDTALSVPNWQYVNRDGTPAGASRVQVVPITAPNRGRDFNVVRSLDGGGNEVFHGYWNGGYPIRVYHMEAATPLAFDYTTATTAYSLLDSDTGRYDVDTESVYVVYDSSRSLYYLTVSKDGNLAPGWETGVMFFLDYEEKAIFSTCPVSGDRSVVLNNSNKANPADPDFVAPRDFYSGDIIGMIGITNGTGNYGVQIRVNAMVYDQGSGTGNGKVLEVGLRTNARREYSGPGRGTGPAIRTPGRLVRASYLEPNANVERIAYYATDRGNTAGTDGSVIIIHGGDQQKVRSNFAGQFGLWINEGSGDRQTILQNLGDPTSLTFDQGTGGTRNLYVCCRNQGQIVKVNIPTYPGPGVLVPSVFASGLSNPTEIADGGDTIYCLESNGASSVIKFFKKDGSGSGTIPADPAIPYIAPNALQYLYGFLGSGPVLFVADAANGGAGKKLLAVDIATGKKTLIASDVKGHGAMGLPVQLNLGNLWDELEVFVKVYWSTQPANFDYPTYITSMDHHAAEWICDTTQPSNPWYYAFTDFRRENFPDKTEWIRFYGWGVQSLSWTPEIAVPVGQ